MADLDRRDFLKLVGLGAGTAAVAGCSDPIENLVPYVVQPEEVTPGLAVLYASSCRECEAGCGLHVRTREGRPIKLEGNPEHPINQGKLCARGQAGIGRTYHPDRYVGPMMRGASGLETTTWEEGQAKLVAAIQKSPRKTWILGGSRGPTLDGVVDAFAQGVGVGGRIVYRATDSSALRSATQSVFGLSATPIFDLSEADLILDFGSDFLDTGPSPVEHAGQFAQARDISAHEDGGARLVTIGPRLTLTGSNADHWVPAMAGSEGAIALALAKLVWDKKQAAGASDAALDAALRGASLRQAATQADVDVAVLEELAEKVAHAKSVVAMPPGTAASGTNAVAANAAVLLLNAAAGAIGSAVKIPERPDPVQPANQQRMDQLVQAMNSGQVDVLLVHDANPLYSLPAASGFREALAKVGTVVSFAPLADETSEAAHFVLPDHTPLESWGDAAPRSGVRSLVQPTIRPLHDTKAIGDTLLEAGRALGAANLPAGTTRDVLEANWGGDFRAALARGGRFAAPDASGGTVQGSVGQKAPSLGGNGEYTVVAYPHSYIGDGSGAALPWMQETPDPVTKLSWRSWAEVSKNTAEALGLRFGDIVAVATDNGTVSLPVIPRGGVRDDIVAIALGQGHTVGFYASMANQNQPGVARGVNINDVLPAASDEGGGRAFLATRASLAGTGAFQRVALSQVTDNQRGRGLAQEISLLALAGGDAHGDEHGGGHEILVPYEAKNDVPPDSEYRWGMTIDTDKCNGCSACIVACYVENNIPIVGEVNASKQRIMNWLRIERYVGDGEATLQHGRARRPHPDGEELGKVGVRHAPMLCQHCGAAPCESVCPVIATYHTPEGLNGMVYNRCVGTRYCANNCTYKVRRFNYFDYGRDNWPGLMSLMLNPDVTVRGQGVMEKCTFCVQRIQASRQDAKDKGEMIPDGAVTTACEQSCPSSALTFGNVRDPKARVNAVAEQSEKRVYHSLHVLNTRPAITYLAQVKRDEESHV